MANDCDEYISTKNRLSDILSNEPPLKCPSSGGGGIHIRSFFFLLVSLFINLVISLFAYLFILIFIHFFSLLYQPPVGHGLPQVLSLTPAVQVFCYLRVWTDFADLRVLIIY